MDDDADCLWISFNYAEDRGAFLLCNGNIIIKFFLKVLKVNKVTKILLRNISQFYLFENIWKYNMSNTLICMFCLFETLRFDIPPMENSWSDSSISPFHIPHGQVSFSFRFWQGGPGKKYRANMDIRVYKYMQQRQEQQINFCLTNRSTELDTELTESGGRRNANRVHSELPPRPSCPTWFMPFYNLQINLVSFVPGFWLWFSF